MPFSLDPDAVASIWLDSDESKPIDVRPTFQIRFLTCRQLDRWRDLLKQAEEETDNAKCRQLVNDCLSVGLIGWKHMGDTPFSIAALGDVLTLDELWELAYAGPRKVRLAEDERRGFLSPSRTAGANSANTTTATANPVASAPAAP